jgi:hypothetical protein
LASSSNGTSLLEVVFSSTLFFFKGVVFVEVLADLLSDVDDDDFFLCLCFHFS